MAAVIKGTTYQISFGGAAYTGVTLTSVKVRREDDNVETIQNADGATDAIIYMNPMDVIDVQGVCTAQMTAADKGDTITFTPPNGTSTTYRCESMDVEYAAGATRMNATLIKEDSMSYS